MQEKENTDLAISVSHVSKTFILPHERQNSIKGKLINFHKRGYEVQDALKDVSFEVKKGEFFGIVGRNGSGKSTLLKILAGIYKPNEGSVEINGKLTPFIELGVGFNHELSGRDNVFLNGALLGFTRSEMEAMYEEIVAFAELERFMDQKLKNYSSGMQVRLAFSIAIRANTDILVLDEVLAVGDANFQKKCFDYFNQLKRDKKTVILVSHDMDSVKRFSDRALLLEKSQVVMVGDPQDVSAEYMRRNEIDAQENRKQTAGEESLVKINAVHLLDLNGKDKFEHKAHEGMKIKVDYVCRERVDTLNIGIGLWSMSGAYVFGYNTQMDNYAFDPMAGSVTLALDKLPLLNGTYYINVVCFGEDEQDPYDLHERVAKFNVANDKATANYRGIVSLPHDWITKS